jgi:hypothetical protein
MDIHTSKRKLAVIEAPGGLPIFQLDTGPPETVLLGTVRPLTTGARGRRMTKLVGLIGVCFLLSGSGSAAAQQQTFACDRICWSPATHSATCSSKLTQAELTAYIYAVQHNTIAKGKGMTFYLDLT